MAQKLTSTVSVFQCIFMIIRTCKHTAGKAIIVYRFFLHSITSVLKADLKYLAQYSYANCLIFESSLCKDSIFIKNNKTLSAAILLPVTTFCFVIEKVIFCEPFVNNSMHAFALPFYFVSVYDFLGIYFKKQNILRIYWHKQTTFSHSH